MSSTDPARFRPTRWLRNPHAQTLWQALAPRRGPRQPRSERWELPDGDFVDLIHVGDDRGPLIVVLHGLGGSARSPYVRGLLASIEERGWGGCLMQFRGCSGPPNRLARSYHSGDSGDLQHLISGLRRRYPRRPIGVVGFSLGGNVLLKWLGERGEQTRVQAAVAVSVPLRLDLCADRLEQGLSRLYQAHLLRSLRRSYRHKFRHRDDPPWPLERLSRLNNFRRFDHHVTAPLHDFDGVDDYYQRCSSRQFLPGIRVPTLIVQALDDPFMSPGVLPAADELSATTTLEVHPHGGHVGFISDARRWRPGCWLDQHIPNWLGPRLEA